MLIFDWLQEKKNYNKYWLLMAIGFFPNQSFIQLPRYRERQRSRVRNQPNSIRLKITSIKLFALYSYDYIELLVMHTKMWH